MDGYEVAKLQAKARLKLVLTVFAISAAAGAAVEYRRAAAPLATAAVVFERRGAEKALPATVQNIQVSGETGDKAFGNMPAVSAEARPLDETTRRTVAAVAAAGNAEPAPAASVLLEAPAVLEAPDAATVETYAVSDTDGAMPVSQPAADKPDVLTDFLGYMRDTQARADAMQKPASALGKIMPRQPAVVEPQPREVLFQEGRIEIYDSEKGVVAVETSTAAVVTDESAKAPQENRAPRVAENPAAGAEAKADEAPFLGETAKVEQNNGGAADEMADEAAGVMTDNVADAATDEMADEAAERATQADETAPVMLIPGAARQTSGNVPEVQATGQVADVAAKDKPAVGAAVADKPKPAENAAGVMTDKATETAAENPADKAVVENKAPAENPAVEDKAGIETAAEYDENVAPANGGAIDMMKDIVARK